MLGCFTKRLLFGFTTLEEGSSWYENREFKWCSRSLERPHCTYSRTASANCPQLMTDTTMIPILKLSQRNILVKWKHTILRYWTLLGESTSDGCVYE